MTAVGVLAVLSLISQVVTYYVEDFPLRDAVAPLFNVNAEQNIPALFSSVMLLFGGALSGAIAHARRRLDQPDRGYWVTFAVMLLLLAVDEFGSIHERATPGLRRLLDLEGGSQWSVWVLVAIPVLALLVLFLLPFFRRLRPPTGRRLLLAGLLFVGGAIGIELLGDLYAASFGRSSLAFELIGTVEETMEMLGLAVLVYALVAYIPAGLPGAAWRLRVSEGSPGSP